MAISVGSVSVDVVPSVRGFATELKAKLKGITANIAVDADTSALRAKLDEATLPRTATINVDADTGAAEAQIDAVARDRRTNVSVGGISAVVAGISGMGLAIAGLGPALIPIIAAVAGLGAALVAPLALAGGGLTIGAILGGFAIKDTLEQNKQITDLAKKVQTSRNALERASTPAGKRSAQLKLAEDTKTYRAALAGLSPVQRKFLESLEALKTSFKGLVTSTGGALFAPFIKGMDLLAKIMPSLRPLVVGVSRAIGTLLDDLGKAASGPGFKQFMRTFGREAGSAIVAFGRMFANFGKGMFNLFRAFGPASKSFVSGLSGTAKSFADWSKSLGSSKSFQSFLGYVRDVGPKVGDALGHIFSALGKIVTVLAPLGALALVGLDALAKFIADASPSQIAAVAGAIGGLAIAIAAVGGPVVAIPAALLAVGGALAFAYTHSEPFRKAVDAIGRVFTDHLLPALKDAWKTVLPGLVSAFDSIRDSVHKNQGLFRVLGDVFKLLGKVLVDAIIPALAKFYSVYLPLLGKAIGVAITVVRLLADAWLLMAEAGLRAFKFLAEGALGTFGLILNAADKGLGWIPGLGDKIHGAKKAFDEFKDNTVAALDAAIGGVRDLRDELNGIKPKTVEIRLKVTSQQLVLNPSLGKPRVGFGGDQTGGAVGATGGIVNRPTVALIGEAGPEAVVPLNQTAGNAPLPGGLGGPLVNIEQVVAHDYNDFMRQAQQRARHAGLDGMRR